MDKAWLVRTKLQIGVDGESQEVWVSTVKLPCPYVVDTQNGAVQVCYETRVFGGEHDGYRAEYIDDPDRANEGHKIVVGIILETAPDSYEQWWY